MLLEIEQLRLQYLSRVGATAILDDVSLHVAPGETVGLVGESGSGKSSTVRAALRLLPDTARVSGAVRICGTDVLRADAAGLRRVRSDDCALIQQDPAAALNPVRRIGDSLTERLVFVHGVPRREAYLKGIGLLASVGITDPERRMRQYPHEFSGGMLQRVIIAAALSTEPKLILADEATSALDVTTQAEVLAILRDQQRQRDLGVLFITHDLHLAAAYCDRVYVLYRGRVVEELVGSELFASAREEYTLGLLRATPMLGEASS
jgi:ABC-type dipeptide/oligopeptide/nickel transport system ATPase component